MMLNRSRVTYSSEHPPALAGDGWIVTTGYVRIAGNGQRAIEVRRMSA
jgi:hypothetical protein